MSDYGEQKPWTRYIFVKKIKGKKKKKRLSSFYFFGESKMKKNEEPRILFKKNDKRILSSFYFFGESIFLKWEKWRTKNSVKKKWQKVIIIILLFWRKHFKNEQPKV